MSIKVQPKLRLAKAAGVTFSGLCTLAAKAANAQVALTLAHVKERREANSKRLANAAAALEAATENMRTCRKAFLAEADAIRAEFPNV